MFCTKGPFFSGKWDIFLYLSAYFSIFHDFRNWASFSPHFWIIQWKLQSFTNNCITTIFKIKNTVCAETPCILRFSGAADQ